MKRDIKYIIKRIIIGVGIALVLANIHKCSVFAESSDLDGTDWHICLTYSNTGATGMTNYCEQMEEYEKDKIKVGDLSYIPLTQNRQNKGLLLNAMYNESNDVFTILQIESDLDATYEPFKYKYIGLYDTCQISTQQPTLPTTCTRSGSTGHDYMPFYSSINPDTKPEMFTTDTDIFRGRSTLIYISRDPQIIEDIKDTYDGLNYSSGVFTGTIHTDTFNEDYYYFVRRGINIINDSFVSPTFNSYYEFTGNFKYTNFLKFYVWDKNGNVESFDYEEKSLQYWLERGFKAGGDDWVDNAGFVDNGSGSNFIQQFIDMIKLPFNFLLSLNRNSCQPLSIPLPFTNTNLQLECLSSRFISVLGQDIYNIIVLVVSGLVAYRITLANIEAITDSLDPDDDKLEVVDL